MYLADGVANILDRVHKYVILLKTAKNEQNKIIFPSFLMADETNKTILCLLRSYIALRLEFFRLKMLRSKEVCTLIDPTNNRDICLPSVTS